MDFNKAHVVKYLSGILVLVFTYTAVSKLLDFDTFYSQMLNQPLPMVLNEALVWFIPIAELIVAGLMLTRKTRFYGLTSATILMAAFTGYVALMVLNVFERVPCSCGGILQSLSWGEHLVVNIILLTFSYIALIFEKRRYTRKTIEQGV